MTEEDFDKRVRSRLAQEIQRRDVSIEDISKSSGLPVTRITEAISGKEELSLEDLDLICLAIDVNLFWLTSSTYAPSKTLFRSLKSNRSALQVALEIENAFLCILDFLPVPSSPRISIPSVKDRKCYMLLSEVLKSVNEFQANYGKEPEEIIEKLNIPVFSSTSNGFDAFLLGVGSRFAICLSERHHPSRLKFSFFHEMAHYLFHRREQLDIDTFDVPKFYNYDNDVSEGDLMEFVANKFAQYSIIPFDSAVDMWTKASWRWKDLDFKQMQEIIDATGSSIDVLVFSLYETFRIHSGFLYFKPLQTYLKNNLKPSQNDLWSRTLICRQRNKLSGILTEQEDAFYSGALEDLRSVLGIRDYPQAVNE